MMWDRHELKDDKYMKVQPILYRGKGYKSWEEFNQTINEYVEGFEYCWPNFVSTSEIKDKAITFANMGQYSILFEIQLEEKNKWNKFKIKEFSKF